MMEFKDFYEIAEYGNTAWKGAFTPKEIAMNAYDYLCEFEESKANEDPTHTIKELAKLLIEDGSEECVNWTYNIASEIGLLDMDYADYLETDSEIIRKFICEN